MPGPSLQLHELHSFCLSRGIKEADETMLLAVFEERDRLDMLTEHCQFNVAELGVKLIQVEAERDEARAEVKFHKELNALCRAERDERPTPSAVTKVLDLLKEHKRLLELADCLSVGDQLEDAIQLLEGK